MILDAHQHLWKYLPASYGWITDEMSVIRTDFLTYDLERELEENHVDGSIAVQSLPSETDTSFLIAQADRNDFIKGVVGWLDICSPAFPLRLKYHSAFPKLRGLRHILQSEPDDRFVLREDFQKGIGLLASFGLTYDLLIYPRQLPAATELVKKFPNQKFVIDHLAKPPIKSRQISPWDSQIREIARFPNVFCKLSGLVTEADPRHWTPEDFYPFMQIVLEAFGPSRLMFGSDWPVCLVAAGYDKVLALVKDFISKLSPDEQQAILGGTAASFYGV